MMNAFARLMSFHQPPLRRPTPKEAHRSIRHMGAQGITLLEVMVALGIAAIVLVAVYRLQTQTIAMESITRFHTQAPLLAERLLADIELLAPNYPSGDSGDFGDDYPGYTWSFETRDVDTPVDNDGRALLKQIDLRIALNDDEDRFTLRTYRLVHPGS